MPSSGVMLLVAAPACSRGVAGAAATSLLLTNLATDATFYFRVAATNPGGESLPSETVGCRRAANPALRRALVVNAFDRFDRTLNLRQTPAARNYKPPGHDQNSGTLERVLPERNTAFSYVVPHGQAISAYGQPFDACQNEAVAGGQVNLMARLRGMVLRQRIHHRRDLQRRGAGPRQRFRGGGWQSLRFRL